jgi:hypothetical protein
MNTPFGEVLESGWSVGGFAVWHERRNLQIKLAEGLLEGLKDSLGRRFLRSLYYEFDRSAAKRIWIPCFISWEAFEFEHKGTLRSSQYTNIFCVPRDVADKLFRRQYSDLFGREPNEEQAEQFWADMGAAVDIFLQNDREIYERSVPDPRPPRFILFEWGREVLVLRDWTELAASAQKVVQDAQSG